MYFLWWNFVGALFCVKYNSSYARSFLSDNFFEPNDDYASLPGLNGDPELQPFEDPASLFSSNEYLGSSIPLSGDGDPAVFPNNDPASAPLFVDDAPLLTAFNFDSALALDDLPLPSFSGESETLASNNLFPTSEFDPELTLDDSCMPGEEQDVSKSKRGDDFCLVTDSGKKSFPPVWANPSRFNYFPENDPRPRPKNQQKNSRSDFIDCPSGPGGYRMYLICDSGKKEDRKDTVGRGVTLTNLNADRSCMLLSLSQSRCKTG